MIDARTSSFIGRYEERLVDACADLIATGRHTLDVAPGMEATFSLVFESEMDQLTHVLENSGYRVWFTCEVDGVEYRLAARRVS